MLIQMTVNYFVNECKISKWTNLYFYFNGMLFIYLFSSFYKKSYVDSVKKFENGYSNNNSKEKLNDDYSHRTKQRSGTTKKNTNLIKS